MGLSELVYAVGSLAVMAALWFAIYWVIRGPRPPHVNRRDRTSRWSLPRHRRPVDNDCGCMRLSPWGRLSV